MKKVIIFVSFFLFFVSAIYSQKNAPGKFGIDVKNGDLPDGIKKGELAPDFTAKDQNGKEITLNKIFKNRPVVIFFYRGYWCPYCNKYLKNYADSLEMVQERGVMVIAVTPERPGNIQKTTTKTRIDITVISDKNEEIMKAYDVKFNVTEEYQNKIKDGFSLDIPTVNDQEEAQLPVPATYIINTNGVIVGRQFDIDYSNRASVEWILNNLP